MKKLAKLFAVAVIIGAVLSAPTVYRGWNMYREAVEAVPVTVKAEEIQSSPDYVKLDDISDYFLKQIIRTEDKRFRFHPGFDPLAIARAVKNDLLERSFVQGGSTITQQLAKNMYFDFGKTLDRKVAEVFTAVQMEHAFTKDEILELYVNCINYGEGCFGIKQASEYYYDTAPGTLMEGEADALVYAIKCPNLYNPVVLAAAGN